MRPTPRNKKTELHDRQLAEFLERKTITIIPAGVSGLVEGVGVNNVSAAVRAEQRARRALQKEADKLKQGE